MNQENKFDVQDNNEPVNSQPVINTPNTQNVDINKDEFDKKPQKNSGAILVVTFVIAIAIIIIGFIALVMPKNNNDNDGGEVIPKPKESAYRISGNSLEPFDLYFLQLENNRQNKVYSPLSIKYALAMLEEGTEGKSKAQISNIIGDYNPKSYINSKNRSFANALFIRDTYKASIKKSYINTLKSKYNAEVKTDSFKTPDLVNSWIKDKTLGLLNGPFGDISGMQFLLINALAIDMDWQQKFLSDFGGVSIDYNHENFKWSTDDTLASNSFKDNKEEVSGMEIIASFNNYDIVKTLGEENIRKTVKSEFEKYLKKNPDEKISSYIDHKNIKDLSEDKLMEKYLDKYIKELNSNYKSEDKTTDFSFYTDDSVKVFAKDLKEYDGSTLQYVGIMPTNESLDSYISKINAKDINFIIGNLKELKLENFKDGVITKVKGFIPKFKFDYDLKLMDDLKKLGITDVFESSKANLKKLTSEEKAYINKAEHKATIEFTQSGIKAAAYTYFGKDAIGLLDESFDYKFDVPVEEIDLTFDKPYMFIIRDKKTGEVWFAGAVYNPLLYSQEQ